MYQGNPEMQRKYQKRKKRKNGVISWEFHSANQTGTLLCLYYTPSELVSANAVLNSLTFLILSGKHHILAAEMYHQVKSFDENLYIYGTCHKYIFQNEIPFQSFCNKTE